MPILRRMSAILVLLFSASSIDPQNPSQPERNPAPVLVELFTSEGCSSCPPADEFLARLNHEQPLSGVTIIGIEEHVDYWNQQGWFDPYSSPEWTSRQVTYVDRFREKGAYTPQAVIDGQRSIVGVHGQEVVDAIQQSALEPRADLVVTLEPPTADGVVKLRVRARKLPPTPNDTAEIWLAVVERDLASKVKAGENEGHQLQHSAVLRSLKNMGVARGSDDVAFEAGTVIKLKREWKSQNLEVVAFAQEKKSKRVLGVTLARL